MDDLATPTFWDHLFVLVVIIVFPVYSKLTIHHVLNEIKELGEPARIRAYRGVILTWVLFSAVILGMWWMLGREWADIGLRAAEPQKLIIGLVIATVVTAIFVVPLRNIYLSEERHGELGDQMHGIAVFMPVTHREESGFKGVSLNAGLSEELIFRGYLMWYLGHFFGLWVTAGLSVLLFGLAHLYQGLKMLPGILIVSACAVALYVYTGSLLVPILFHIALDALQGAYIARIQRAVGNSGHSKVL